MRPLYLVPLLAFALPTFAGTSTQDPNPVVRAVSARPTQTSHPKQVGGTVSAPELIYTVDMPGLAKMDAGLVLSLWVDMEGVPSHIRIIQGGDLAQNDKIIDAVRQYRFKPAMENGKPVLVEMNMEVNVD